MSFSWLNKFKAALISTLPMVVIVLIIHFTGLAKIDDSNDIIIFVISAVLVALGMGLFTIGTDLAMSPIGEYIGASITSQRKIGLMVFVAIFLLYFGLNFLKGIDIFTSTRSYYTTVMLIIDCRI